MKNFVRNPCPRCGELISNAGFAYTRHDKACQKKPRKTPLEKLALMKLAYQNDGNMPYYEAIARINDIMRQLEERGKTL